MARRARPSALRPQRPTSLTLLDACADPDLFAPWFGKNPAGWVAWFAFMRALFGLPLNADQRRIYRACTGRTDAPDKVAREVCMHQQLDEPSDVHRLAITFMTVGGINAAGGWSRFEPGRGVDLVAGNGTFWAD